MKRVHWAWYILGASFFTALISYSIRLGYGIILPEMMKTLGISRTEGGLSYSMVFIMYTLFAPVVGRLTDRIGARRVITFFCAVLTFGTLMMGTVNRLMTAMIFLGVVGIGLSSTWAPVVALTTRWFGSGKRGFALGFITLGAHLGYGVLGLVLPVTLPRYSWRFGWTILGLCVLAVTLVNGILLRNRPEDLNTSPWGGEGKSADLFSRPSSNYREILRERIFWQIGISYFFISFCYYSFISFIVTYGSTELRIGYGMASAFASTLAFGMVTGALPISTLSDFLGRKTTIFFCESAITVSVILIIAAKSNLWMIFISIATYGIFFGSIFPLYGACSRDYFEKEVTGTVLGAWTFIYGLGAVIAPFITGYLSDLTGTFRWPFGLAAFAAGIAALLMFFLKNPKKFMREQD
jgi:sugar phosphate permease